MSGAITSLDCWLVTNGATVVVRHIAIADNNHLTRKVVTSAPR